MNKNKNRLDFTAQLSRHSHDVHAGYASSIAPGMIIPQYFHVLSPGDTIYAQSKIFSRLLDVVTAFMGEIDIHLDSFFVPMQMLYTPFGSIFTQTNDFLSSAVVMPNADGSFPVYDIATAVASNSNALGVSRMDCWGRECARLLDALDLNPLLVCSASNAQASGHTPESGDISDELCKSPMISPWIIGAYNAIYQKHFRNDEVEQLRLSQFNIDQYSSYTSFNDSDFFSLHYVQRPKDYFTSVRVSPIASAVNKFGSASGGFPDNGGSLDSILIKTDEFLGYTNSSKFSKAGGIINSGAQYSSEAGSIAQTITPTSTYNVLNAQNIRALFAVDKFARIYGRADKTYDDQILAHFGVKIPHDVKHDITHISHYRAVLQSDPVISTANVASGDDLVSSIGQVGGQGSCDFTTGQDKFTAPVHGVFMIVAYVVTKPRYFNTFSKLHLLTNRLAFPIPEYDKLGAQPLYNFEFDTKYLQSSLIADRYGWQNRYQQFKEKYNRASLCFNGGTYSPFITENNNIYSPWVVGREVFEFADATEDGDFAYNLFENPRNLDVVMQKHYSTGWPGAAWKYPHLLFQNDPIFLDFTCNAKLVSWMSETGEPDL